MAENEGGTTVSTGVKFPFGLPGKTTNPATSPTTPKTGVSFQNGFPGKGNSPGSRTPGTGTSKNAATNTNNRGGGHGRGTNRGNHRGGPNHSVSRGTQVTRGTGRGSSRGRGRGHSSNNNNNNNNNNNVKVGSESIDDEEAVATCAVCDRPKGKVQCFTCGWNAKNLRVKTVCTTHPKVNFLGDLTICPQCQTAGNLEEVEEEEAAT